MQNKLVIQYRNLPVQAKAAAWFMVCSIIQKGFSIITLPLFTRMLSEHEYGLVTTYFSWETIVDIFICLRLDYSVFNKGMSKYGEKRDGYVVSMQVATTIAAMLMMVVYILFSQFFIDLTGLSGGLCLLLIIQGALRPAYSFWMLKERYRYNYIGFVTVTLFLTIFSSVISVIAVYYAESNKGEVRIVSNFVVICVLGVLMYILNIKNGWKDFDIGYIKFALLFNFPLIFHYLSTYVLNQSDRIMIQKMVGMDKVGIYGVAYSAGMLMTIVSSSIINAISPWYYEKLKTDDITDVKKMFLPIVMCIFIPVGLFILFAPEFMNIVAPPSYYEGVYVIPPVAISIVYLVMYSFFSIPEFHYNANKFSGVISSVAAIINIASNYIFIKVFGFIAAGYTTMLCYMLLAVGHYLYSRKIMTQNQHGFIDSRTVVGIIIGSAAFVVVADFLYSMIYIRIIIVILMILLCFAFRHKIFEYFKAIRNI